ncbi:phycocyanin operon protein Y [Hydrococcus rivularis NIES-593]|uniref:Phycocyanin operon protein Y n=1 Tax=Hydrococcus rivularis NIES-593 TaxID=1921803 RepID=A0A1U7HRQ5_9CYAN|nr:HEAT repeat domain-containing protein [Hydrococcus rivularis]OKH26228.1 phycocyanin operon protein Y [Hydrococcus rivularis NIES-593]
MDKRFFNIFNLTEDEAIALLKTPPEQLEDKTDRYIAASHLINFPTERAIDALIEAVRDRDRDLYNRITRRKAIESLGRLKATAAIPVIRACLADEDCYTVENAVWAIGEIGTDDEAILEEIAQLLDKPEQSYRVIIQTLAKFNYRNALDRIQKFVDSDNEPIASAAIAAVARFSGDYSQIDKVVGFLQHESVNARRACIQDLIDAQYYDAIPEIAKCPVSVIFRLRGIRLLADAGTSAGKISFQKIEPHLDRAIRDRPDELNLVHEYDQLPSLAFLVNELYQTDFGRCYLASKTLLETYPDEAPEALMATYAEQAHNDYGAHYHVIKLLGWLKYAPAFDLLVEALQNPRPQFQKSRAAAAIALANLGDERAIPLLKASLNINIWDLKYACLLALKQFGDDSGKEIAARDPDWLVRAKAMAELLDNST